MGSDDLSNLSLFISYHYTSTLALSLIDTYTGNYCIMPLKKNKGESLRLNGYYSVQIRLSEAMSRREGAETGHVDRVFWFYYWCPSRLNFSHSVYKILPSNVNLIFLLKIVKILYTGFENKRKFIRLALHCTGWFISMLPLSWELCFFFCAQWNWYVKVKSSDMN